MELLYQEQSLEIEKKNGSDLKIDYALQKILNDLILNKKTTEKFSGYIFFKSIFIP